MLLKPDYDVLLSYVSKNEYEQKKFEVSLYNKHKTVKLADDIARIHFGILKVDSKEFIIKSQYNN